MTTNHRTDTTGDAFETRLREGLDHLASTTPTSEPGEFDPDRWPLTSATQTPQRVGTYLVAAAAVVAVTVAGLVAVSGRLGEPPAQSEQPAAPPPVEQPAPVTAPDLPTVDSIVTTIPEPVRGVPTCGAELPVTFEVPSALEGPLPGPAASDPTLEGQFAQYWELPAGTIEVRWPADPREVYDLDRLRGDQTVFEQMSVGTPEDGSQAQVKVPNIDPGLTAADSTLTMTATSSAADLQGPCDLVQVRYIDGNGNQTTRGYDVTNFAREPAFGVDLNPLVTIVGDAASAPDLAQMASCGSNDIDRDAMGPAAATPAEALDQYLDSDAAAAGFIKSGYREYEIGENEFQYATFTDDSTLLTLFTVSRSGQDWSVSHVISVGC